MRVHGSGPPGDFWWRPDGTCSQCGSVMPERAAALLATRGTAYAVGEWSYGWPDRLLLGDSTFYVVHLAALDDHEVAAFARLTAPLVGITWSVGDHGLDYVAPRRGHCSAGVVGSVRAAAPEVRRRRA